MAHDLGTHVGVDVTTAVLRTPSTSDERVERDDSGLLGGHGPASTYTNWSCRCEACTTAHREAMRRQSEARLSAPPSSIPHGTRSGYQNWGCRCEECLEASRQYGHERRAARELDGTQKESSLASRDSNTWADRVASCPGCGRTLECLESCSHCEEWGVSSTNDADEYGYLSLSSGAGACEHCGLDLDEARFDPDPEYCEYCDPEAGSDEDWGGSIEEADLDTPEGLGLSDSQFREAQVYLRLGCTLVEAVAWIGTDPDVAAEWIRLGFGPEAPDEWPGRTPSEAVLLRELRDGVEGRYHDAVVRALSDPTDRLLWSQWSTSLVDVAAVLQRWLVQRGSIPEPPGPEWKAAVSDLAVALQWSEEGFEADAVRQWIELGCDLGLATRFQIWEIEPEAVRRWVESGAKPDAVADAADLGAAERLRSTDPRELVQAGASLSTESLVRWAGLTTDQLLDAVDSGYEGAEDYLDFGLAGISAEWLERTRQEGTTEPSDIHLSFLAEQRGLRPDEVHRYVNSGVPVAEIAVFSDARIPPGDAAKWVQAGLSAEEAESWIQVGVRAARKAEAWKRYGVRPAQARQWIELGIETVKDVRPWLDASFSAKAAKQWVEVGMPPSEAVAWAKAKVPPPVAARRRAAGLRPPPVA